MEWDWEGIGSGVNIRERKGELRMKRGTRGGDESGKEVDDCI